MSTIECQHNVAAQQARPLGCTVFFDADDQGTSRHNEFERLRQRLIDVLRFDTKLGVMNMTRAQNLLSNTQRHINRDGKR